MEHKVFYQREVSVFAVPDIVSVLREARQEGVAGLTHVLQAAGEAADKVHAVGRGGAGVPLGGEHGAGAWVPSPGAVEVKL